jgi:hypothetical protein
LCANIKGALWFGKALPRVWLSDGETVNVTDAATAYGKVALQIRSNIGGGGGGGGGGTIRASIALPDSWSTSPAEIPAGGVVLRLRAPDGKTLKSVTVGGQVWTGIDAVAETITITAAQLGKSGMLAALTNVVATYEY